MDMMKTHQWVQVLASSSFFCTSHVLLGNASRCLPTPNSTPTSVSSSSITTLKPYISPKSKTTQPSTLTSPSFITKTVSSSSYPRPRPSTTTNHLPLSSFFVPQQWNKYFHIPAHAPYSVNTFQFQKCIQRQVERVTFHTRPDRPHLVIVDTESQTEAMLTVKHLDEKPLPVSQLNPIEHSYWYCSHTPSSLSNGRQLAGQFFWTPWTHCRRAWCCSCILLYC